MKNRNRFPMCHCRQKHNYKLWLLLIFSTLFYCLVFAFRDYRCRTQSLTQICLQRKARRYVRAGSSPSLSRTENRTVFDAFFLLLLWDVVVFEVVNTLRINQYNKQYFNSHYFNDKASSSAASSIKLLVALLERCTQFRTHKYFRGCMNFKPALHESDCLSLLTPSPLSRNISPWPLNGYGDRYRRNVYNVFKKSLIQLVYWTS